MKLYTFGTCSGTEPRQGFHHTCLAVETHGRLFFIDAGESGAYAAHLMGADLLSTKAVFITHPHMDHVGGLGNLLWYIRKIGRVRKDERLRGDDIEIFCPCKETVDATFAILRNTEGGFECDYTHTYHPVHDGIVYDTYDSEGEICVRACHTTHIQFSPDYGYRSYAYRFTAEGKTIVFSGDIRLEDFEHVLPKHCDVLVMETGHHQIEDIAEAIKKYGKSVDRIFFVHHGGYIMRDLAGAMKRIDAAFDIPAVLCLDSHCYEI